MFLTRVSFALVACFMAVQVACSPPPVTPSPTPAPIVSTPTATVTATPTMPSPSPTPDTSQLEQLNIDGLETIVERFGFALIPEYLPEGLKASGVSFNRGRAQVAFGDVQDKLFVTFPVEFSPEGGAILVRPQDSVFEVDVDGQKGHMMKGAWSDATISQGPGINPSNAEWDYDKSLTLFYDYQNIDGENIGIAVQALFNPSDWITEEEIVLVAESLMRVE